MRDVTLTILAGGQSSRMGAPKAEIELGGKPILQHLLDRWNWTGPTMLVTAPQAGAPRAAERFDQHVRDPVTGSGPLQGVLTALHNATTPLVVVAAIDMPNFGAEQLKYLADQLERRSEILGLLLARKTDATRQIEPLPSCYRRSAAATIEAQLARQRRAVRSLLDCPGFVAIDAPGDWAAEVWINLNHPEDLRGVPGAAYPRARP